MIRCLKLVLTLCLVLNALACSAGAKPSPTATAIPPTLSPTATLPPSPRPTLTPTALALHRPAQPQLGLNFICFYWTEQRAAALNKTTFYYQPNWIFRDWHTLGVQAFRQPVKADLLWDVVEPEPGQWNWEAADAVLKNLDFEPIVTLFAMQYASPTPPWTSDPAQFQKELGPEAAAYVETVVKRYAPFVKYWELGNEMDHWRAANPAEKTPPEQLPAVRPAEGYSPQEQGKFLAQAAALVRRHDPDAVILMPGLSSLDDYVLKTWLPGVIQGGGKDWFDVVSYHYYAGWERYIPLRPQLDQALKKLEIADKPVWLTETGATASPSLTARTSYPNSPETQAADVFRRIVQAYGHGDALVLWHTYMGRDDPQNDWRMYGLRTQDAQTRPAYYAFKLLASELIPFELVERVAADAKRQNIYRVVAPDGAVKYVAWGGGNFVAPVGVTQMTSVIPKPDGSFAWQDVQAGKSVTLGASPILFK